MALIKCPECGKEISEKAPACIHCGCPINNEDTQPPKEEKFKIVLKSDANKIQTIKLLMELKGVSLVTGKNIVDTCPITIFDNLTLTEAQDIISKFNKIGSDVTIGKGNNNAVVTNDTAIRDDKKKETIKTSPINTQPNNTAKNTGCTVAIIIAVVIAILAVIIGSSEDHNDGKCDICGKSASKVSSNAELCTYHILWANDEYYKDNENYEGFGTH